MRMIDILLFYIIIALFFVIGCEFAFLLWVMDRESKEKNNLLAQLQNSNRALVAKNEHDYVMRASIDKVVSDEKHEVAQPNPDERLEESMSDDEFFDAVEKSNKIARGEK